jgi:threonine/homoserine/homoserine lactone efflux protein
MDATRSAASQGVLLGGVFVLVAATTDTAYVLAASVAGPALAGGRRGQATGRYLTALTFIGLGLFTAASGSRASR